MQEHSEALRAIMRRMALSQTQLAEKAGVSQPTVSRMLKGAHIRHGTAKAKLFKFIQRHTQVDFTPPAGPQGRVLGAFMRIWDKTEEHAAAIVRVIDALGHMPTLSKRRQGKR